MGRSALVLLAWLGASACAQASDEMDPNASGDAGMPRASESRTVAPGRPAVVTPTGDASGCRSAYLTVELRSFQPPASGHAHLLVRLHPAAGPARELGRAGVFPFRAFTAPATAQRYGFTVDPAWLRGGARVSVELAPPEAAQGARAEIGEVSVGPLPGERC
jgi:hypothetical protein